MFGLKPHNWHPDLFSEQKQILKLKKGYWTVKENYGRCHYFHFNYWENNLEFSDFKSAVSKKRIFIPLNWYAFYVRFIYKHLGKCHKDLRSKFYIGKARN